MVRNYVRKTERGSFGRSSILDAVKEVRRGNSSVRKVAREYGINYQTLGRYCKKITDNELDDVPNAQKLKLGM